MTSNTKKKKRTIVPKIEKGTETPSSFLKKLLLSKEYKKSIKILFSFVINGQTDLKIGDQYLSYSDLGDTIDEFNDGYGGDDILNYIIDQYSIDIDDMVDKLKNLDDDDEMNFNTDYLTFTIRQFPGCCGKIVIYDISVSTIKSKVLNSMKLFIDLLREEKITGSVSLTHLRSHRIIQHLKEEGWISNNFTNPKTKNKLTELIYNI